MARPPAHKGNLADYARPPLIEVVFGVKFVPLKDWMIPHVGAFWHQVMRNFPRCEHAPPIGDTDVVDAATGIPLPRVWLIASEDDRLIQLQPGRFLFNWRDREGSGPYPRYKTLSSTFFALFRDFRSFVTEQGLGDMDVLGYELTYINHVLEQNGWKFPEQLGRVINQLEWQDRRDSFLPHPSAMSWQVRFAFQEQPGGLSVKLSPARRVRDDKPFLVLELSARGLPAEAPLDRMEHWFSHAHEWIVRGFEDLTSDEARKGLWGQHD